MGTSFLPTQPVADDLLDRYADHLPRFAVYHPKIRATLSQMIGEAFRKGSKLSRESLLAISQHELEKARLIGMLQAKIIELGRKPKLREVPYRELVVKFFGRFSVGVDAAHSALPARVLKTLTQENH